MIEQAGVAFLVYGVLEALAKTDRGDQEKSGEEQIPRTGQQVRGMRDRRGGGGKKSGARHIRSQGNDQQNGGGFLSGVPRGRHVALDGDGRPQKKGKQSAAYPPNHLDAGKRQGSRDQR